MGKFMIDEIYNQINQDQSEEVYHPRLRIEEKKINHTHPVNEIVYNFLRHRYCPLLYQKAHDFVSINLQHGFQPWNIDHRLKAIMEWGKSKNVQPLGIVKVLNREIMKLK